MNQNFKKLQNRISSFCKDRDWDQFHSPKNLAISISIEAAELLENFQWDKDNLEIEDKKKERISKNCSLGTYFFREAEEFKQLSKEYLKLKQKKNR